MKAQAQGPLVYFDEHVAMPPVTTTGSGLAEIKAARKKFRRRMFVMARS